MQQVMLELLPDNSNMIIRSKVFRLGKKSLIKSSILHSTFCGKLNKYIPCNKRLPYQQVHSGHKLPLSEQILQHPSQVREGPPFATLKFGSGSVYI